MDCEVDVCDDVDIDMSSDTYGYFEDDVGVKHGTECERVRQYNPCQKSRPVT